MKATSFLAQHVQGHVTTQCRLCPEFDVSTNSSTRFEWLCLLSRVSDSFLRLLQQITLTPRGAPT